jgi:hypothetical protein
VIHGNGDNDLILGDSGAIDYVGSGLVDGILNGVLSYGRKTQLEWRVKPLFERAGTGLLGRRAEG